jgi:hypothetical protein
MSRFVLYPAGQPGVPVMFDESQEAIVLRALREHRSRFLHVEGNGEYAPDGTLKQVVSVSNLRLEDEAAVGSPNTPIWQRIAELGDQLPDEIVDQVPADASSRLDEYLYGGRAG